MFSITAAMSDGLISINATLFVQIINLLVLIFILNRVMYRPIRKIVARRAEKMKQGQTEVEKIEKARLDSEAVYLADRRKGRSEVRRRLAELRQDTEKRVERILAEAMEKGKDHQVAVLANIEAELTQARADIRVEAEKVALGLAGSILGREVS